MKGYYEIRGTEDSGIILWHPVPPWSRWKKFTMKWIYGPWFQHKRNPYLAVASYLAPLVVAIQDRTGWPRFSPGYTQSFSSAVKWEMFRLQARKALPKP